MTRTCLGFVLFAAFALGACSPGVRAAKRQASADFSCDSGDLSVTRRSNDAFIVRGCGRTGIYQCPTGVGTDHRWCTNLTLMAKTRFSREFRCSANEIRTEELSPLVFRVTGCDSEASYHCSADDGTPRCVVDDAR